MSGALMFGLALIAGAAIAVNARRTLRLWHQMQRLRSARQHSTSNKGEGT